MRWDEQRFNLEYDLDRYMIVASNDFNMGAMENKGLNVFNTKYVLADAKTATDDDFINVEAVVGHEYFHNWTGNRVTCRDWFQLSLKEGLTVFRDQEFTADLHSSAVKRIQDIKFLRQHQFTEDNSPLSHPVRPDSYIEINNFYTLTIYEKGAEIVRMYQTIFGKKGFEAGLSLYFMRHDGQAVTCNEFCQAMADANHYDLNQFMLWYSQAGTPKLSVLDHYDEDTQIYSLTIEQHLATSNQNPMLIPLKIGLLDDNGLELDYNLLEGNIIYPEGKPVLLINQSLNYYRYKIKAKPIPSLLRDFSAPIILNYNYTQEQLFSLANYDSNSFSRWEALQTLYKRAILELYNKKHSDLIPSLINIVDSVIFNHNIDPSMRALLLTLPEVGEFFNEIPELNIHQLLHAINQLKQDLANQLVNLWLKCYHDNQTLCYDIKDAGKRKLKTVALHYLAHATITTEAVNLAISQYDNADNMTDKITALTCLNNIQDPNREKLLANFVTEYNHYPLVMDKWFMLQSQSKLVNTLDIVNNLLNHPNFDATNPNKLFALIRGFTQNHWHFNTQAGYQFIAEQILLIDQFNSGVAGRIAQGFSHLTNLAISYQQLAKPYLNTLLAKNISKDVFEIISKINAQLT
jgi:aminopeptidase N